jgi:TetR/AcrR family transcriptional regulator, regulator of cefoperazone and chloramphenicol sensitivity
MTARNIVPKARRRSRPKAAPAKAAPTAQKLSTREQLLETAGQVFSEKGYAGATGKEICERCGANAAAVVYHFGGMEDLYREVLQLARSRLVPSEALAAGVAQETDPKQKLTIFIGMLATRMTGPASSTWAARLISREMISPTPIFDEIRNKEMRGRAAVLRGIVSELMQLPEDHPAVARSCINIMAPFGVLLLIGPQRVERAFPVLSFGPDALEELTRHMVEFALGGLEAISRNAR